MVKSSTVTNIISAIITIFLLSLLVFLFNQLPSNPPENFRYNGVITDGKTVSLVWNEPAKNESVDGYYIYSFSHKKTELIDVPKGHILTSSTYGPLYYWNLSVTLGVKYELQIAAYKLLPGGFRLIGPKTPVVTVITQ